METGGKVSEIVSVRVSVLLQCKRRNISQGFRSHGNEAGFSLQQDVYIGESCGVGYQAQVLRIATILYSMEGTSPAGFFDTQVESE